MPVLTRSSHNLANSIINNIVDNTFTIINNRSTAVDVAATGAGAVAGVSASIGLGCCSICLEDIQFEKGRFVLECGHAFHSKCILTSFQHGNRCPNCRTEVVESIAHEPSYMMPASLRVYSSIIHDAADHFIHDLGNITFANVVHRMLLMSSESQDLRSIQYPYIKRLLVQFASVFIQGVAFSVRDNADGGREIQDPVPIDIVDNMMAVDSVNGDPDYDAAISNPALDAAVAYQAIVTTDMNFDSLRTDNVGSALIRRSVALAAMGSQRAELALRRATALSRRRQQMQEVHHLLQRAQEEEQERGQEQVNASSNENQNSQQQNINMVISENQNQNQNSALNEVVVVEEEVEEEEPNPWGVEF